MKLQHFLALSSLVFILMSASTHAQCGGNGGAAALSTTPQALGATMTLTLSGGANQAFGVFLSTGTGLLPIPGLGTICLDVASPSFGPLFSGQIPGTGSMAWPFVIPNDPALLSFVLFLQGVAQDPGSVGNLAISQALRIDFENPDSYVPLPPLATPRALATASPLRDGRVLICGGGSGSLLAPLATNTCDLFDPLTRSTSPGPLMSSPRALHTATILNDGRVLVCGGVTDALGTVTPTCEIYDPALNTWSAAQAMASPRATHTATLLASGGVLVTGGTTTLNGTLVAVLNASTDTGEVYFPNMGPAGTWVSVLNSMNSPRFQSSATRLSSGRVLITSAISGAFSFFGVSLPIMTATTNEYDPATNSFISTAIQPNAVVGHRTTLLPNGNVWLTGGAVSGLFAPPATTSATWIYNGVSWAAGPALPTPVALHGQVLLQNGDVQVFGGLSGNLLAPTAAADSVRYNGSVLTTQASLPLARGAPVAVTLASGAVFLAGGADPLGAVLDSTLLYTPNP